MRSAPDRKLDGIFVSICRLPAQGPERVRSLFEEAFQMFRDGVLSALPGVLHHFGSEQRQQRHALIWLLIFQQGSTSNCQRHISTGC